MAIIDSFSLLADHSNGGGTGRRPSVLHSDGDEWRVRAKLLIADQAADHSDLLQLRVRIGDLFHHLVLDEAGQIITANSGTTDDDAWQRVKGELSRKGYELV